MTFPRKTTSFFYQTTSKQHHPPWHHHLHQRKRKMSIEKKYEEIMRALPLGSECRLVDTTLSPITCCGVKVRDETLEAAVVDPAKVAVRRAARSGWGGVDSDRFERARSIADPLFYVNHNSFPFRTRAALKLADINQEAHFIGQVDADDDTLMFADLCGAPGSWTEYLLWAVHTPGIVLPAVKGADGWGFSLTSTGNALLDWQLEYFQPVARAHCPRIQDFTFTGETGDGDITSAQNLIDFMMHVQDNTDGRGLDVAMGDGGIIHEKNYEDAEGQLRRVVLGEVLAMLLTLRKGGNFVLKVLDIQTTFSVHLLWVLYNEFEAVDLAKPTLSRPANSERYFVGKRRRNDAPFLEATQDAPLEIMKELAAEKALDTLNVCRLLAAVNALEGDAKERLQGFVPAASLSKDFLSWLRGVNDRHIETQTQVCQIISDAIAAPEKYTTERVHSLHNERCAAWWERSNLDEHKNVEKAKKRLRTVGA